MQRLVLIQGSQQFQPSVSSTVSINLDCPQSFSPRTGPSHTGQAALRFRSVSRATTS